MTESQTEEVKRDLALRAAEARKRTEDERGIGDMQRVEKMKRRADARGVSLGSSTALFPTTPLLTNAAVDRATQRPEKDTQAMLPSEQPAAFVPEDIAPSSSSSSAMHCMHCARIGASYIADSHECIQQQKDLGCHACDRVGCYSTAPTCPYFGRARAPQVDSLATGSAAPDMFRRSDVRIYKRQSKTEVIIDGTHFIKGYATSAGNNCLVDALTQAIHDAGIPCMSNNPWVRQELLRRFPRTGESAVTLHSFLDLRRHWRETVDLIGESARSMGLDTGNRLRANTFRVVCIEENRSVVGDADGDGPVAVHLFKRRLSALRAPASTRRWN